MHTVDSLTREELIVLLNKCWMTHDGMWFLHSLEAAGIKAANKMNKRAIQSLAAFEIGRIKVALGVEGEIDSFASFKAFFVEASRLIIPSFMNVKWTYQEPNLLHWEFPPGECFAYKGVKRMGILDDYECGVLHRVRCWLENLGIRHTFQPGFHHCLMHTRSNCAGTIQLYFQP